MAIVLDETTKAEYDAQTFALNRAALVVSALSGTVVCEVYDGFNVLRASGTMASPWATASGSTITVGEVNASGVLVASGGAPDANWYCQFRSGTRFVRGTFGVAGSGRDFTWTLSTFETGSRGTIGTATLTAQGGTGSVNSPPVWAGIGALQLVQGQSLSIRSYVSDPDNDAITLALVQGAADLASRGIAFDATSGTFTASVSAALGLTGNIIVSADDGFAGISAPTNSAAPTVTGIAQVGQALSASSGSWIGGGTITYAYQWARSGVSISGATSNTYTVQTADIGATLRVTVTATNSAGSGSANSASTAAVTAAPATGALSTTFSVVSAVGGTDLPFAFGHPFRQGDVPAAGNVIASQATDFQCTPLTYWPDGSVRHAIIAGRTTCTANVAKSMTLALGTAPAGTTLDIATLKATIPASTTVSVGGTTMTLAGTFLDSPFKVVCAGPVMSNWIYRTAVSGSNHLVIWCDVRLYKGGTVELFPWVENAYLNVSGPTSTTAACAVSVGGVSRFSQSLSIAHHTRVPLLSGTSFSYWAGTDPQITPSHNSAYLRSTKCVPNIAYTSPSAATLNALTQSYTPNTLAGVASPMSGAGGSGAVLGWAGLPGQALYVTTGDARAYRAAMVLGLSGGSWSSHYRDEATNEPPKFSDYPSLIASSLPAASGSTNGVEGSSGWATHQPSFAYLPWLITARWWFLDEQLFWSFQNYVISAVNLRRGDVSGSTLFSTGDAGVVTPLGSTYTVRGAAWALRTLAQAFASVPATHPCFSSLKTAWESNVTFYKATFVDGTHGGGVHVNTTGTLGNTSSDGTSLYKSGDRAPGSTAWWGAGWMHGMLQQAWGHSRELTLPQSTTSTSAHNAVCLHALKLAAGLAGDGLSGNYNWRRFIVYALPISTNGSVNPVGDYYADFGAVLTEYESGTGGLGSLSATAGLSMKAHFSNTDFSAGGTEFTYGSMQLAALSYAVDTGVAGAQAGYDRITGAYGGTASSSWAAWAAQFNNDPVYGIVPRSAVIRTGLTFPSNNAAGSDIGLDWSGPAMVPRNTHTVIWKARYVQQTGYYAWAWHVRADNTWGASQFEFGTHPYPASSGSVSGTGQAQNGTGAAGTVHYFEIAGLLGGDFLTSPGGAAGLQVTKGVWYTQARQTEIISGTTVRHRFWPDIDNNPSFVIVQDYPLSGLASPPAMKFRFGASPWTASGSANEECPSGTFRHFLMYDRVLSLAEIQAKAALTEDDTTDVNVWYSNINPTPSDVSDKSGRGRSPAWANANRPSLYQG